MSTPPKDGDLRVWNIINPPHDPHLYPVESPEHAAKLIDALAKSQLLEPYIQSNCFGCEVFRDDDWEEWEDPETGDDIDAWWDNRNDEEPVEQHAP